MKSILMYLLLFHKLNNHQLRDKYYQIMQNVYNVTVILKDCFFYYKFVIS
jgi:hypothetical protein